MFVEMTSEVWDLEIIKVKRGTEGLCVVCSHLAVTKYRNMEAIFPFQILSGLDRHYQIKYCFAPLACITSRHSTLIINIMVHLNHEQFHLQQSISLARSTDTYRQ